MHAQSAHNEQYRDIDQMCAIARLGRAPTVNLVNVAVKAVRVP